MSKDLKLNNNELKLVEEFSRSKEAGVLTILFTDLIGYTKFSENHKERTVQEFRKEHDELLKNIIEKDQKGKIIKFMGDACMAIFASPTEAVKISKTIKEKMNKFIENKTYKLDIRIGLHMGEVVVEDGIQKDIFGRHVNRAQRIESLAQNGQILLSFSVYDSAKSWLDEEEYRFIYHGNYRLKGIKEEAQIYELFIVGNKPKAPHWKFKFKKYKFSFYILLFIYLATATGFLLKNSKIDLIIISGKPGYLYIDGDLKGVIQKNYQIELKDINRFSKITVEVNGKKQDYSSYFASDKLVLNLHKDNNPIKKENFVKIESGKNSLGQTDKNILVSKYEVTEKEFLFIMKKGNLDQNGRVLSRDVPISNISWYDAIEYCNRLSILEGIEPYYEIGEIKNKDGENEKFIKINNNKGYRLLSKNEWLYTAAGGKLSKSYKHSGSDNVLEVAVIGDWSKLGLELQNVGSKKPNELGLYDMSGNVSEWTGDSFNNVKTFVMGTNYLDKYQENKSLTYIRKFNSNGKYHNVGFRITKDL